MQERAKEHADGGAADIFASSARSISTVWLDSLLTRYGFAALCVALAVIIKLHVPFVRETAPFLFFFGVILAVAWHGGLGPGILATLLSALASKYYFVPPLGTFSFTGAESFQLLIFIGEGAFISLLCQSKRRIEDALFERAQLNRAILDSLVAHIAVLDAKGNILAVNAAWEGFAHQNDARDLACIRPGASYLEACRSGGDSAREAFNGITAVLDGQSEHFVMEYPCHAPGEERWFLLFATPLPAPGRFSNHRIARRQSKLEKSPRRGAVISHVDITQRHRAESERLDLLEREKLARQEAERANNAKDEFLATISHELRTPLSSIVGWCQLLQSGQLEEEMKVKALEVIARSAHTQTQLIEDLLDVARIVSGKLLMDREPLEFALTVGRALETLQPEAQEKLVALEAQLDGDARVLGDTRRLQQVVWNLVHNAIKFSPSGARIEVKLACEQNCVRLEVRDDGAGIEAEFLPQIFERFRQAKTGAPRRQGGLGLGLSIARHIVEEHGGQINAFSEGKNRGAIFVVELPRLPAAEITPNMSTPHVPVIRLEPEMKVELKLGA